MSMKLVKRVPTGDEIKELYPLSSELKAIKARRDEEIRKIFVGDDDRFIFIIGPCSADNEDAVCDYQNRLAKVADEVKDKIFYFFDELFYNETAEQVELPKTLLLENAKAIIEEYAKKFTFNIGSQENWFEELKVIGAELGYCANRKEFKANPEAYKGMISDVAGAVRSALSHRTNTPDLYTIMQIIGEEKVRERFNRFLEL